MCVRHHERPIALIAFEEGVVGGPKPLDRRIQGWEELRGCLAFHGDRNSTVIELDHHKRQRRSEARPHLRLIAYRHQVTTWSVCTECLRKNRCDVDEHLNCCGDGSHLRERLIPDVIKTFRPPSLCIDRIETGFGIRKIDQYRVHPWRHRFEPIDIDCAVAEDLL